MLKRLLSLALALSLLCFACIAESTDTVPDFKGMNDPALLPYIENTLYQELVGSLNSDEYFVENVSAIYISQEYLDELAFNSQANIFFGYTLAELDEQFQGTKYVFTLGEKNETVVEPFEAFQDNTYSTVLRNVAIGAGVILVCVTVSVATATAAPAVSMIFAMGAKTGAALAINGAKMGFVSAGILHYMQTGNLEDSFNAGLVAGSEGFKWGAIVGSIIGGGNETIGLIGAEMNGLKMSEAALIQRNTGLPLSFIKNFHSIDEYNIYKEAGLLYERLGGSYAYTRTIDLKSVITDQYGKTMTNAQRILEGNAPVDPSGIPYELHHIGQQPDSPLAILTKLEHIQGGNNKILHFREDSSVEHGLEWVKQKQIFWNNYLNKYGGM